MALAMDRKVEFTTLIRVTPERVYDAIATAEGLDGWLTKGATVDARPGGQIRFHWKEYGLDHYSRRTALPFSKLVDRTASYLSG